MMPLFALVSVFACWDTASTLCRGLDHEPLKQIVSRCFLCAALFLAVFHVLGFLEVLGGWAVVRIDLAAILAVMLALATRLVRSTASWPAQAETRPCCAVVLGRAVHHVRREPLLVSLAVCALVVQVLLIASVLSAPPRGFDALWYHLPNLLRWYRSHTIDVQMGSYVEFYPGNGDLLGLPLLTLHNDSWVGLVQYPWFVLAALITRLLAQRAGVSSRTAWAAGLTVLTIPILVYQAMQFYVDVICAALSLGTLLYLIDWMRNERTADLSFCMLTGSMLLGTKYIAGFAWVFPIAIVMLVTVRRRFPKPRAAGGLLRRALLVCGVGTALTWLWWARNTVAVGNPIAPVHIKFVLHVLLTGHLLSSVFAAPGAESATVLMHSFAAAYGPLIVLMPPVVAITIWRLRAGSLASRANVVAVSIAYVAWCAVTFVFLLTHEPRFVIAPVLVSLVLAPACSVGSDRVIPRLLLLVTLVNTGLVVHKIAFADDFALSINRLSRNRFYGLPDEIDRLPAGARVLLRGHPTLVYPVAGAHRTNAVFPSPMGPVEEEIARWHIDYVFVRTAERSEIARLAALPSLAPIEVSSLPHHYWWDYWPHRQPKFVALFKVVR